MGKGEAVSERSRGELYEAGGNDPCWETAKRTEIAYGKGSLNSVYVADSQE